MRAIALEEPGLLRAVEVSEPGPPGPGEARVRVRRVGICGTDLHAFAGRQPFFAYPRVLGHELAVEVIDVGHGVTDVRPGDACAVRPYLDCGRCDACRRGRPNCCAVLAVLGVHVDGGLQERLLVPAANLHPEPRLSFDRLALVETLAIAAHAVARAGPVAGERALVLGAGPIGLGVLALLREAGVRPVVADLSPARRAFAADWSGALPVDPGGNLPEAVAAVFDGQLPTLVMDATGSAGSMAGAFELVANGGRLVLVGLVNGDITFHDPEFHRRELTLLASRNATATDVDRTLALLVSGAIDPAAWITHRTPLDGLPEALPRWAADRASTIKGLVDV